MKHILLITTIFLTLFTVSAFSQTGPGGVGNSSNNAIWLDASRMTLSNNALVNTFVDRSGNGNNLIQGNNSYRPTFQTNVINGLPAIYFSGSNFLFQKSISALNTNQISYFLIANTVDNSTGKDQDIIAAAYSSSGTAAPDRLWGTQLSNYHNAYRAFNRGSSGFKSLNMGWSSGFQILNTTWNGTAQFQGVRNGTSAGNRTDVDATPSGHERLRLGCSSTASASYFFNGSLSEVILFTSAINVSQRRIIENYLSAKYNLPVSGDLYSYDSPTDHNFDVAGIGQTTATDNHTVAQGPGIVEISNPSDLNDNEFLLFGHNNGALTLNTSDVPLSLSDGARLNRTWRAGHTGNLGTINLSFDITGIAFNSNDFELLIDGDGIFIDASRHTTGMNYDPSTNIVTFTNVSLADGIFFTLYAKGAIISISSGNWNTPTTWSCNCVPGSLSSVTIDSIHTVNIDANSSVFNLTLLDSAVLDFTTASTLTITGNLTNNGFVIAGTGTFEFTGSVAQNISSINTFAFNNLTLNNSAGLTILSGTYELSGALEILAGNFDNSANNPFTFISSISGDARIGVIPSGYDVLGTFSVQRYVAAGTTGYRFLTSPVSGETLADWNDDFAMRGFPGIFNGSTTGDPSVYSYVEALSDPTDSYGYVAATDISNPLNEGEGLWVYMGTATTTTAAMDVDVTGPLYTGTRSISHITYNDHGTAGPDAHDGWNLVGNPFVSTIDWNSLTRSNLHNRIQIWNANTGSYGVYDGDAGTSTNGVTNLIASSQGFYVQANGSPSLSIPESSKSAVNGTFVRTALTNADAFKMSLSNNLDAYSDEIIIRFNQKASLKYDEGDILKLSVPDKKASYIATESDGSLLAFNTLPESLEEYFIPVIVKGGSAARYTIGFENLGFITDKYDVYLKDLNNEIKLDLSKEKEHSYEFNITDPASEKDLVLHIVSKGLSNEIELTSETMRKDNEQVSVYSTPGNITVNFDLEKQSDATITVYNLLGQQMFIQNVVDAYKNSIRLNSDLNNGIYIISVETKDLKVARKINL